MRAARRMAERRGAPWLAVFVETAALRATGPRPSAIASHRALRLAEQLGGEAVTIPGERRRARICCATRASAT